MSRRAAPRLESLESRRPLSGGTGAYQPPDPLIPVPIPPEAVGPMPEPSTPDLGRSPTTGLLPFPQPGIFEPRVPISDVQPFGPIIE